LDLKGKFMKRRQVAAFIGRMMPMALLWLASGGCAHRNAPLREGRPELRVAAAADLQSAFREIAPLFERETGAKVTLIFGSTGLLAKQAERGAPFDVLCAADESYLLDLEKKSRLAPGTRALYAVGRLVIWTRKNGLHPATLADLAATAYRRIAIATPEHAPYGAAAKEALENAGIWKALLPRLVYGENVQQALQYAQTGNADAAIVALSLAIGSDGVWVEVPGSLHRPLRQALAVLSGSAHPSLARRFSAFVNGPTGRALMRSYGFDLPEVKNDK
jgi:molybdate transport system substrate-binding protein